DAAHGRVGDEPGDRQLEHRVAVLARERLEVGEQRPVALATGPLDDRAPRGAARARRRWLAAAVFTGQEAAAPRGGRDGAQVVRLAERQLLLLGTSPQQVVVVLGRDEAFRPEGACREYGFGHTPGRVVAAADLAHLPGAHQVVEGTQDLVGRHRWVGDVDL